MNAYAAAFFKKIIHKLRSPAEFSHVSWPELFAYTIRQGISLKHGPVRLALASYRQVNDDDAAIDTPYGTVFIPKSLDRNALRYLLREAFDPFHWHHFDSAETPVDTGDVVIDCGSSEGLWALTIARKAAKIYLIEPQIGFVRVLRKTFAQFIQTGVAEILNCAVGSYDDTCVLSSTGEADVLGTVVPHKRGEIRLCRLDTLLHGRRADFIKADIEGSEIDMLRGAEETIRRWNPKIAITVYHEANDWQEMCKFVQSINPSYDWKLTGMTAWGKPLMLRLWVTSTSKHRPSVGSEIVLSK